MSPTKPYACLKKLHFLRKPDVKELLSKIIKRGTLGINVIYPTGGGKPLSTPTSIGFERLNELRKPFARATLKYLKASFTH